MEMAWKVILRLLYYKQLFGTPIISDNRLPLLTENIFQTPPPFIWTTTTPHPQLFYPFSGFLPPKNSPPKNQNSAKLKKTSFTHVYQKL